MCKKTYFQLNEPVMVATVFQEDDKDLFQIDKGALGEIIERRNKASFLQGWVRIAIGPNDEFFVDLSRLEQAAQWMTKEDYHLAVAAKQIFQTTWLDDKNQQFELIKLLEAHQWVSQGRKLASNPVFLPIGTIGKVYELSWDFEGTADKQYWMMGIRTTDGRRYDVMYPDLLEASKPYVDLSE
ncbi:hypothetical protein [Lactiplantibacillus songbeiensis]|uniref:DUF1642 domain-containing protein n=1 Tax=Lactiplantibacillus songbeiensis TaxID=2559920 RepID=A0ABW4BZQ5_9LACO|nr:hypothetical protein [Lactiplantibacillus songbeiensis]